VAGALLSVLQPLARAASCDAGSLSVWRSKMPAVLLVLEVALRQVLPAVLRQEPGNSSSSSNSSSSNNSSSSSLPDKLSLRVREILRSKLCCAFNSTLLELVQSEDGSSGPLRQLLVQPSSTTYTQQQQQQQLAQQVFSLAASHLKVCRSLAACSDALSPASAADGAAPWLLMFNAVFEMLQQQLQSHPPGGWQLPAVRSLLAPCLALSGAYFQQAAADLELLQQKVQQQQKQHKDTYALQAPDRPDGPVVEGVFSNS
jgi:hypothetical protein